jgi:ribosomal protein S18 acetylase RimI-like enzyme
MNKVLIDKTYSSESIVDIEQAQIMREIRNECRDYMTRDTSFISEEQQEKWFAGLDKQNMKMFLMSILYHGSVVDIIGFGYCVHKNNETYLTGGLDQSNRGRGYGKKLFLHLIEAAKTYGTPITLEVLNTNMRAKRLYSSIGFREIESNDRMIKMEYKNDSSV